MSQGQIPAMEMMEGIALAVAGVLLITPGFITDAIGMLCLIPASRQAIIRYIMSRASVHGSFNATMGGFESHHQPGQQQDRDTGSSTGRKVGRTIEGEYKRED
jgi:UPF0716 protein FxsA